MDLPSFLIGLLPVVVFGFVGVVAFRRRHDRRGESPMILNPYTLAVEPDADVVGQLPVVQPAPGTTTGQKMEPVSADGSQAADPTAPPQAASTATKTVSG